jgi:hypothetical protein
MLCEASFLSFFFFLNKGLTAISREEPLWPNHLLQTLPPQYHHIATPEAWWEHTNMARPLPLWCPQAVVILSLSSCAALF